MAIEKEKRVLAMYDVRGIQKYIYRTSKLKDAMGASRLIDDIVMEALKKACKNLNITDVEIEWEDQNEKKPKTYNHDELHEVQVLYIGGGNAFVSFVNEKKCIEVNERMAKYIIEKTYSLQLASVYIPMTENYANDYKKIFEEMNRVKSNMEISRPLGILPIMKAELKTGLPIAADLQTSSYREQMSKETYLKWNTKNNEIQEEDIDKLLDSYARRGQDSRIAVVHIDGNNMGLRIRKLIESIRDYQEAVTKMRQISYNIKYSYLNTFNQMKDEFEKKQKENELVKRFVRKVVVAGDDITYVCNAYIAIETVEWFCKKISALTMNAGLEEPPRIINDYDIQEYGFSVCAGIAYIRSHFPFGTAYRVAESCCDEAKSAAKSNKNKAYYKVTEKEKYEIIDQKTYMEGISGNKEEQKAENTYPYYFEKTGNFFDFQICKNIQCLDLEKTREKEFTTVLGEKLLIRPYYIPMQLEDDPLNKINSYTEEGELKPNNYEDLKRSIQYFSEEKNFPRSFAKEIRNTYSLGRNQIGLLAGFLDSRDWKLPNGQKCTGNMYLEDENTISTARWYDALEIIDYSLSDIKAEKGETADEEKED